MRPPIIFLHIPKTAGQSVNDYLCRSFKNPDICPARTNNQLCDIPIKTRKNYRLFSGHLDWSQVYGLHPDAFTFSTLREPVSRILSFYFFLRRDASMLSQEELQQPYNVGLRAALEMSPDEYFMGGDPSFRSFLDDQFDNFYSYYFAGRTYSSRNEFLDAVRMGRLTSDNIIEIAKQNIRELNGLYRVNQLDRLESDLDRLGYSPGGESLHETRVNVGSSNCISPIDEIRALGLTDIGLEKIHEMTVMDMDIWLDNDLFY
jgi:hypothetical protein